MRLRHKPLEPVHVAGMHKGEEMVIERGHEPGRNEHKDYRAARDSTSINPDAEEPIHPAMPHIPPA